MKLDDLTRDLRHSLRALGRTPGFTFAAILALALGIGGSAAVFSVLDGVVLRPLSLPDPERLVRIDQISPRGDPQTPFAPGDFKFLEKDQRAFEGVAAWGKQARSAMTAEGPESVAGAWVTGGFFDVLHLRPQLGRGLTSADDPASAAKVVLLSDNYWRRRFGGDPAALGKTVALEGVPHTIVGVVPRSFGFPALRDADLFFSAGFEPGDENQHTGHGLYVIGRLKPGVTLAAADQDVKRVAAGLREKAGKDKAGFSEHVTDLRSSISGDVRPALLLLLGATLLVLLIACFNVASMLLARGATRQRELAIRAALGSSRGALFWQLLSEALLLGLFGGLAGTLLAAWGVDLLVAMAPPDLPRLAEVRLDGRALCFALAVSLASGLLAGTAPALHTLRLDLHDALKASAGSTTGAASRTRFRSALVVAEIALALVLVLGAGLLLRSFQRVLDVRLGLDPRGVFTGRLGLSSEKYDKAAVGRFAAGLLERARRVPGVESAALTSLLPTEIHWLSGAVLEFEGEKPPGEMNLVTPNVVTDGYFETLKIPILRGRGIGAQDVDGAPPAVVVNEAFVKAYFGKLDPLGQRLRMLNPKDPLKTIVGVAGDVRVGGLDQPAAPQLYLPLSQFSWPDLVLLARTSLPRPLELTRPLAAEVLALDRGLPLFKVRTLEAVLSASVGQRRFQMLLAGVFAAIALVLAAVGIYAVMAWQVAQRTRELGVRMALGAPRDRVLRMVLAEGLTLAGLGVGLGLLVSLAGARALQGALFEVSPSDPATYALVAALLAGVAALACLLPAHRATRVDPAVALRSE